MVLLACNFVKNFSHERIDEVTYGPNRIQLFDALKTGAPMRIGTRNNGEIYVRVKGLGALTLQYEETDRHCWRVTGTYKREGEKVFELDWDTLLGEGWIKLC
jgi:hypothetical protein